MIALVLFPILVVWFWLGKLPVPNGFFSITSRLPVDVDLSTIRLQLRFYACLVDMIPAIICMMSFYYLSKLFSLYAQNIIFSLENVLCIRKLGIFLLCQVAANLLIQPINSVILTYDAKPGEHLISIGIGGDEFSSLIIGGAVIVASWIMEEARKLDEEKILNCMSMRKKLNILDRGEAYENHN